MQAKILVTGATGKVGREVVNNLNAQGVAVRAGVHSPEKSAAIVGRNVEIVHLDYDDGASIDAALEGIETLCLITPPHFKQVDWATLMIDKAKVAGVKHVVRLSVIAAAMEPGILLARWHRTVERYLQASGLDWTLVRPGPFMQNFLGMYNPQGDSYRSHVGDGRVTHIDVRDVARAITTILTSGGHEGQVYMLTGAQPLSFNEATAILSEATGKRISYEKVPPAQTKRTLMEAGQPEWLADVVVALFAAFSTGAVGMVLPTFEQLTGEQPGSFERFARDYAAAFRGAQAA